MYQQERMEAILEYIKKNKRISVDEICSNFEVSKDTARRDLVNLEKDGLVFRTHGGAILPAQQNKVKGYTERLYFDSQEKKAIGKLAATLIRNDDKIIMDTSTTVQACAELVNVEKCTVITNSINLADIFANKPRVEVYLLGGQLDHEHRFLYGSRAIDMLSNYYVDKAFIGVQGITENGLTVDHEEEALLIKKMIQQATQVVVLADHSKFKKNGYFKIADLKEVDLIITDAQPELNLMKIFQENKIEIMLTDEFIRDEEENRKVGDV